jgi:hypothetical protein
MTHLVHLVRTDARRFRVLLAIWTLVAIAEAVFRVVRPALAGDQKLSMMFDLLATVLFATRWLGMILIVALVVQAYPLVGSDAFWMTRPIPWRLLLASRLVLLGTVLVAVPALSEIVLMVACRVPVAEVAPITLQLILFQCLWIFIVMALSSLTKNLARLALVAGSVLIGLILLLNLVIAVMVRGLADGPQMDDVIPRMTASSIGPVLALLLTIAALFAPIAVQYRTRSVGTAVVTGVAGILAAFAIAILWPSPTRQLPVPDWATRESAVQLVTESSRGDFRPLDGHSLWSRPDGWQLGHARWRVGAVEEGWLSTIRLKDASISFDDEATVRTAGNGYSTQGVLMSITGSINEGPRNVVARQVLGVSRLLEGPYLPQSDTGIPAIILTETEFKRRLGSRGTYRGSFLVDLDQLTVAATLPLQAGVTYQGRRKRLIIDQMVAQGRAATIRLRHITSTSIFDSDAAPQISYYLRNRTTSEAVAGFGHGMAGLSVGLAMPMLLGVSGYSVEPGNGFSVMSEIIRFPGYAGHGATGPAIDLTPDWLSQAELVIVHTIPAGTVSRSLEVTGFEIAEAPARPPG